MNKKNLILGGVLIILIALAYLYQGPLQKWQASLGKAENFLAKVDVDKISKIEITKEGKTTTLEKNGDKLKVGGTKDFYVEKSVADNLISSLKEAIKSELELVSSNKEKKSEFETNESGTAVKIYEGDNLKADFIVGKFGSDFASSYISRPGVDSTYRVKGGLSGAINQSEWRDNVIFSSDKEKINKIRFQYPTREFTVEKSSFAKATEDKDDVWNGTIPYKFGVSKDKMDKILNIMSNLTAAEIPEQNFAGTGLEKNIIIIQATGEGVDNTLMVGDSNGKDLYYAKKGLSDNIYLITKNQRDELNKKIQELK
jgi:hypothetical protein